MLLRVSSTSEKPLYQQLRDQIVEGIAVGELLPGEKLPSVRSLATDLGINLHTVNKAYAVLRDEGYVAMRGRSGAVVSTPGEQASTRSRLEDERMDESLFDLALAFRARGGSLDAFAEHAATQAEKAFSASDRG
ncbi:GntR family transcriptional regulator [Adlercreutzia aquisgranensis]|uniref:GntR family transcriptional regulator n=1 Tax=Adlercreutzia aquisgranensis TaxID=2941323 RepID=UPI00203DE19D|nr:GntR family transcriptional regulator [Adlercreutzia aquisgranensis]